MSICERRHGRKCHQGMMFEHKVLHPADEILNFRFVDVVEKSVVQAVSGSKYAALSYVRDSGNSEKFFHALQRNMAAFEVPGALDEQLGLPDRIPRTIQDAIQVAREIGIRFLWVDCLCVQDDNAAEKEDTIKKSHLIYGAAHVVIIAATGSGDAPAGLPGVRSGTRGLHQPIEEIAPGFRLAYKAKFQDELPNSVYFTRAWK